MQSVGHRSALTRAHRSPIPNAQLFLRKASSGTTLEFESFGAGAGDCGGWTGAAGDDAPWGGAGLGVVDDGSRFGFAAGAPDRTGAIGAGADGTAVNGAGALVGLDGTAASGLGAGLTGALVGCAEPALPGRPAPATGVTGLIVPDRTRGPADVVIEATGDEFWSPRRSIGCLESASRSTGVGPLTTVFGDGVLTSN